MTSVTDILDQEGIEYQLFAHDHGATRPEMGLRVASSLGVEAGQLLKTLMVSSSRGPLVALVPADRKLDFAKLANVAKTDSCKLLNREAVESVTGYLPGGVCPFGQKTKLPTFVDQGGSAFDRVICSGGASNSQLRLNLVDLVYLCEATVADITQPGDHAEV